MKPFYCCLVVTDKCMLRCKMCHMWKEALSGSVFENPSFEEWKGFIRSLRRFIDGDCCINFAGGETLINDDVLQLVKYACDMGFSTLINTNAFLISEDMAKKISDSGLTQIYISLDSMDESTHDYLRGVKGVYRKVMDAIEYLHSYNKKLLIKISTVILEKNLVEIIDLARWVIEDKRISAINFQAVSQPFNTKHQDSWYEDSRYDFLWPKDSGKVNYIMDKLAELKQKNGSKIDNPVSQFKSFKSYFDNPQSFIKRRECHIHKHAINVSASGEVYMCFDKGSIGNIKADDFELERVWSCPHAESVRKEIMDCRRNCLAMIDCNYDESESYIY